MDRIDMPHRAFEHLLTGFVCYEGADLARTYKPGGVAHPGDPFGTVFAWLWEERRGTAVSLFADLLAEARRQADPGKEVTLDGLLRGLRFALHNTPLSHYTAYQAVEDELRTTVPEYFGGDTNI
ncbi:hypothetical protein RM572_17745 [Streptomyces sp. DSM 42041]|uniref:Uncharacterized protein n=1 Tax=Streptomyces hazeniae TaxID=3075538 RepID=A0ABU2NUF2_9ACTN|nr:hypothetical protein [Streptomyces sp. DSM 42041]MDT0380600.1 hypothetical protein [Streptomyces sp. DSM 42041]